MTRTSACARVAARGAAALAALLVAARAPGGALVTGLDHVPIAVRNLEVAAADYRRLGFTLKPGRYHEDGIRNLHAKFRDGTELELITAEVGNDETTRAYVDLLAAGEGGAYAGFYTPKPAALLAELARLAPDYRDTGALLMRPQAAAGGYLFFGGRNHSPTDRPEHFVHANGAQRLIGVWLADADPDAVRRLLFGVGARLGEERACTPGCATRTVAHFAEGTATLLPVERQLLPRRPVVGAVLSVRDWGALSRVLKGGSIPAQVLRRDDGLHSAFVSPEYTHGLWLEFREQR